MLAPARGPNDVPNAPAAPPSNPAIALPCGGSGSLAPAIAPALAPAPIAARFGTCSAIALGVCAASSFAAAQGPWVSCMYFR